MKSSYEIAGNLNELSNTLAEQSEKLIQLSSVKTPLREASSNIALIAVITGNPNTKEEVAKRLKHLKQNIPPLLENPVIKDSVGTTKTLQEAQRVLNDYELSLTPPSRSHEEFVASVKEANDYMQAYKASKAALRSGIFAENTKSALSKQNASDSSKSISNGKHTVESLEHSANIQFVSGGPAKKGS